MARLRVVCLVVVCTSGMVPVSAFAQTNLVDTMTNFLVQNVLLTTTPGGGGVVAHTPAFANDPKVTDVTALVTEVSQQIGAQIATFPLGSSSSGFTYAFDSALGTYSRTTRTFGPAFAERAITSGKGKFSFGLNYIHASYESLDGLDLEDGSIKFNLLHQALTPPSFVEGDVIQAALKMKLSTDTAAFLFSYGLTDRFDIGLAVPIVKVDMNLTYRSTILDFATKVVSPTTHVFADGSKVEEKPPVSDSASGLGDVVLIMKYNLVKRGTNSVAAAVDLTFPSGDEKNMLGSGATLTKLLVIVSGGDRVSPHANFGYTFASGNGISNQINYVGGVEYAAHPRLTIIGDLLGRTLTDTSRFENVAVPHTFQQGATAPVETTTIEGIASSSGNQTSGLLAAGVKYNPWGRFLISAHVLFPLNDSGLRAGVTPVIGVDYSF